MLYVVVPCVGWVALIMSMLSPSGSLSFASTLIWLLFESSGTVAVSLFAFGGSFTPPTVM
jgi:hypothetical protein